MSEHSSETVVKKAREEDENISNDESG
ncbi:unnamed protein product, partial [Rotaria sp. Silwood1]